MAKKRFRKRSELVKNAVKNTQIFSAQESYCRNVLRLNGIKEPSLDLVRKVMYQQQLNQTNKKYKELTCKKL